MIGGSGIDTLVAGNRGGTILFGGTTSNFDEVSHLLNLDALGAIMRNGEAQPAIPSGSPV